MPRRLGLELVVHGGDEVDGLAAGRGGLGPAGGRICRGIRRAPGVTVLLEHGLRFGLAHLERLLAPLRRRLPLRLHLHVRLNLIERDQKVRHEPEDPPGVVLLERLAEKLGDALHGVVRRARESLCRLDVGVGRVREGDHDVPEPIVGFLGASFLVLLGVGARSLEDLVVHLLEAGDNLPECLFGAVQVEPRGGLDRLELGGQKFHAGRGFLQLLNHEVQQAGLPVDSLDVREPEQGLEPETPGLAAVGPAVEVVANSEDTLEDGHEVLAVLQVVGSLAHELVVGVDLLHVGVRGVLEDERRDALRQPRDRHNLQKVLLHSGELRLVARVVLQQLHLVHRGHA